MLHYVRYMKATIAFTLLTLFLLDPIYPGVSCHAQGGSQGPDGAGAFFAQGRSKIIVARLTPAFI